MVDAINGKVLSAGNEHFQISPISTHALKSLDLARPDRISLGIIKDADPKQGKIHLQQLSICALKCLSS